MKPTLFLTQPECNFMIKASEDLSSFLITIDHSNKPVMVLHKSAADMLQLADFICKQLKVQNTSHQVSEQDKFKMGDLVYKIKGSAWTGHIVGTYTTKLTPKGYCVESDVHFGSVQIYPASALAKQGDTQDAKETARATNEIRQEGGPNR